MLVRRNLVRFAGYETACLMGRVVSLSNCPPRRYDRTVALGVNMNGQGVGRAWGISRSRGFRLPVSPRAIFFGTSHPMKKLCLLLLVCCASPRAFSQHLIELRGSDTKYRYVDWFYTFPNSAVIDLYYNGVPGSNEFSLGGGYGFKASSSLLLYPLIYAALAREGSQSGVKIALLVTFEKDGWKLISYLTHFAPLAGKVPQYQALDTLDVTKTVRGRWEAGVSNGFFHTEGKWNPLVGPVVRRNDRLGFWGVSYRFGPENEFRVIRVITLRK